MRLNQPLALAYYLGDLTSSGNNLIKPRRLPSWKTGLPEPKPPAFPSSAFLQDLGLHRRGLLAYYDYPISLPARVEGTSNKIKTMQRQAYGFRDQLQRLAHGCVARRAVRPRHADAGEDWPAVLGRGERMLAADFAIDHVTLQPSWPANAGEAGDPCWCRWPRVVRLPMAQPAHPSGAKSDTIRRHRAAASKAASCRFRRLPLTRFRPRASLLAEAQPPRDDPHATRQPRHAPRRAPAAAGAGRRSSSRTSSTS